MTRLKTTLMATVWSASVVFAAAQAQAQDVNYLDENATHCEIFSSISMVIPGDCALGLDAPAANPATGLAPRTRGIVRYDTPGGTPTPVVQATVPSAPAPAPVAAVETPEWDDVQIEDAVAVAAPAPVVAVEVTPVAEEAIVADATPVPAAVVQQDKDPEELGVALRVEFEYDSYRLTGEALQVLDRVAAVLNDPLLRDSMFLIEGHTDAAGPDAYNVTLSERRAQSVRQYLAQAHGVDFSRLAYMGKGESELYNPTDPYAAINRRVEIRNISVNTPTG